MAMMGSWDMLKHRMPWSGASLVLALAWWWPVLGCSGGWETLPG